MIENPDKLTRVAVVIPCYKEKRHIMDVLNNIPDIVSNIFVVDDCCPDKSGKYVEAECKDPRVKVVYNEKNLGVGGAMINGYKAAIENKSDIVIKLDGDNQMDPALIPQFIKPIINQQADYTKGNRFYSPEQTASMPRSRLAGNILFSFLSKISTGYWNIFDHNNGYTAIHRRVLSRLPLDRLSNGYFFEVDILFRLNALRAVTLDIPMNAVYRDETSHMNVPKVLTEYIFYHAKNTIKRMYYNYFLRDFQIASLQWVFGALFLCFGVIFGSYQWFINHQAGVDASAGTVMIAALSSIFGMQLLLAALSFDMQNRPQTPLHTLVTDDD